MATILETLEGDSDARLPAFAASVDDSDPSSSDEDHYLDEDDYLDKGNEITRRHRTFLREFEDYYQAPARSSGISEFMSSVPKLEKYLSKTGDMKRTILHLMANKSYTGWKDLFRWLMSKYPNLYQVQDELGSTILATGCSNYGRDRDSFITFFFQEYPEQAAELTNGDGDKGLMHLLIPRLLDFDCPEKFFQRLEERIILSPDRDGNTILHFAAQWNPPDERRERRDRFRSILLRPERKERDKSKHQLKVVSCIIDRCPAVLSLLNNAGQSAYQYRLDTYKKTERRTQKELPVEPFQKEPASSSPTQNETRPKKAKLSSKDPISWFLKCKIMHLKSRGEITQLLYGKSQGLEIELDLLELANLEVAEADLKTLLGNLQFENILQYVRVPDFTLLEDPSPETQPEKSDHEHSGRSKVSIFDHLHQKGVRKIIRVTAQDRNLPHSDEMIEKILTRFDVEIWDWEKLDICSEVIFEAAPNVREVCLYSSGNNAVLRSWSLPGGLDKLPMLTNVSLCLRKQSEGHARTARYVDEFMQRMATNSPLTKCRIQGRNEPVNSFATTSRKGPNSFLEYTDRFAAFIRNISKISGSQRSVKVAIVDDGVDLFNEALGKSVKTGVSFARRPETGETRPYYFSSSGQGTLMAKLIHRVCPTVSLYIARIDADPITRQPALHSIDQAIFWAIDNKVDIISLGWAFETTDHSIDVRQRDYLFEISRALRQASDERILIFASTGDHSVYRSAGPQVLSIGSLTSSGTTDYKKPIPDFVLPGSDPGIVSLSDVDKENPDLEKGIRLAFATALASGLAALFLCCAEICQLSQSSQKHLHDGDMMRSVLKRLTSDSIVIRSTENLINPMLEDLETEEGLPMLAKVIREFVEGPI